MNKTNEVYNIQLQINSELRQVRLLSGALQGIGQELALTAEQVGQLELILVEAVNNVIEHAYEFSQDNQVKVQIACDPSDTINLVIADQGKALSTAISKQMCQGGQRLPEPESLPESGWGMGLIHMLADSFRYERNEKWNYWYVSKRLA